MSAPAYNLAIETSGRVGSVSLGCGDQLLATAQMPPQERHRVDLMPTIDALCREHAVTPPQIAEVYLSIGPGSFTGLRIGVATAKMLAMALGAKVVAVPTLEVVAQNAGEQCGLNSTETAQNPKPRTPDPKPSALAVCLNVKKEVAYTGFFHREGNWWRPSGTPALRSMADLLGAAPRPLAILGDPLPTFVPEPGVTVLPAALAVALSQVVWTLGRVRAQAGEFADTLALAPLYVREPEAVELWNKRHPTP